MSSIEVLQRALYDLCLNFYETEVDAKDIVFSTHSIFVAFLLLYVGSMAETKKQLEKVFGFDKLDTPELYELIALIAAPPKENNTTKYELFNSIWAEQSVQFKDAYIAAVKKLDAVVDKVDFSNSPESARAQINAVVMEKTGGLITELLSSGSVTSDTIAVLVNTIYFKGEWTTPFETAELNFKDVGVVAAMEINDKFQAVFNEEYTAVKVPYNANFSMVVVMPKNMAAFEQAKEYKNVHNIVSDVFNAPSKKRLLKMPKYSIEWGGSVKKDLINLGLTIPFTPQADFKGVTDTGIVVSDVIHKAIIKVDEKGTVATAATAIVMELLSSINIEIPLNVIINKPFFFVIVDPHSLPIFFGKCTTPKFTE
ncbi:serine protease inhibitor, serpin, putative [Entamoeba invadens IP1]|uniref:Serine protease inhibitor, serpin, putative n=1 Tax=Entamoeba invadens IP1 TaxID=370355 RepID=L7FK22_ENTIV|nr:serine protease inhibitor, serpin, putative [Entamoeba invadens IP1]ELP84910.1 serine protease inhibitor, serpin, putative [Entamoeba invadens IP1]|eukprot:XP_004184256.1 serine protease inhibitor, serpin, putative [Entamoeba invadens IP1]